MFQCLTMAVLGRLSTSKNLRIMASTMANAYSTAPKFAGTTVDEQEMTHFKNISNTWWKGQTPLHSMNQLRIPFVRDGLINTSIAKPQYVNTPQPLKDLEILEVGCGGGILSEALARLGCITIGLDASTDLIKVAKDHATLDSSLSNNLTYICDTIENHATNSAEKYDAIVSSEVIEHVTEKQKFIEACVKCLKPGGSIFITTFNKSTAAWLAGIIMAEYVFRVLPKGTHHWEKFIAPHQLQRLLEDYNCYTTVIHGMMYNVFTDRWSWTSNNLITYALQAVKS